MLMMAANVWKISNVPLVTKAADFVEDRWMYIHTFMHGGGYACDPEFFLDTATSGIQP